MQDVCTSSLKDRSGKEQNSHPCDGKDRSENRLPADLFLEGEVTDWQNNNRWQGHEHVSAAKTNLAISSTEFLVRPLGE